MWALSWDNNPPEMSSREFSQNTPLSSENIISNPSSTTPKSAPLIWKGRQTKSYLVIQRPSFPCCLDVSQQLLQCDWERIQNIFGLVYWFSKLNTFFGNYNWNNLKSFSIYFLEDLHFSTILKESQGWSVITPNGSLLGSSEKIKKRGRMKLNTRWI